MIHADSDDCVELDSLSKMVSFAEENGADVLICDFWQHYENRDELTVQRPCSTNHIEIIKEFFPKLHGSCCNKLVRINTIRKYNVKYNQKLTYCEDLLFNLTLLSHPVKIEYLDVAHYHYFHVGNSSHSLTSMYNSEMTRQDLYLFSEMEKVVPAVHPDSGLPYFASTLVHRAYIAGLYNSREFRRYFYGLANHVKKCRTRERSLIFMLYISCCGFYFVARSFTDGWLNPIYKLFIRFAKLLKV